MCATSSTSAAGLSSTGAAATLGGGGEVGAPAAAAKPCTRSGENARTERRSKWKAKRSTASRSEISLADDKELDSARQFRKSHVLRKQVCGAGQKFLNLTDIKKELQT